MNGGLFMHRQLSAGSRRPYTEMQPEYCMTGYEITEGDAAA